MDKCTDLDKSQRVIDDILKNKEIKLGIPDIMGSCSGTPHYFPCDFSKVVDYNKGMIEVYEKSIGKYHTGMAIHLLCNQ